MPSVEEIEIGKTVAHLTEGGRKSYWKRQLKGQNRRRRGRDLVAEDDPGPVSGWESCVMCYTRTARWLQPENVPLCNVECLSWYLKDPTVYDPRGLHRK